MKKYILFILLLVASLAIAGPTTTEYRNKLSYALSGNGAKAEVY